MEHRIVLLVFLGLTASASIRPPSASGQDLRCDPGDVEVRRLVFEGNRAFSSAELSGTIVTTPSGWGRRFLRLPITVRHCLDRRELPTDRLRLLVYYRRRGFPRAVVDTAVTPAGRGQVEVKFRIGEGEPTRLSGFVIEGLEGVPNAVAIARGLPIRAGLRFDRNRIEAARDTIARRLRNDGYPQARVVNSFGVDAAGLNAWDTLRINPGPLTRIGKVEVAVTPFAGKTQQIPNRVVERIVGLNSGRLYREDELLGAQRRLYQTEAYQHVALLPDSQTVRDSVVDIRALLLENTMRSARLGAGYGTLDCFRVTGELSNYNFLSGARRLDLTGRVSKIGIGEPLAGAKGLCGIAGEDPYSNKLNYYAGATLRQPLFFGLRVLPAITVYTERVSEYKAYLRTTAVGGIASLGIQRWRTVPISLSYSVDYGRTEAQPALFCAVFNLCDREDRERIQQTQRLAVLSLNVSRETTNNLISPTRGSVLRAEGRHASPAILSDDALQFNKLQGEASKYWSLGRGHVFAMRLRTAAVFGRTFGVVTGFVPPQERLYAGGPTSVRGFNQNELGSSIYIASGYDTIFPPAGAIGDTLFRATDSTSFRRTVPLGGNSLVVGNAEIRLRSPVLPDLLQVTVFTDVGDVWNRGASEGFPGIRLKVTPGIQFSAFSPVGPIRAVIGYNPYRRPPGPLYYESSQQEGGTLPCVSPANVLKVHLDAVTGRLVQEERRCPSSFQPAEMSSFRRRLTFSLAIGQAF